MKVSDDYLSNRAWLQDVVGDRELILRGVSALEYMQMFVGYFREKDVYVYAREKGFEENIHYCVLADLSHIETETLHGVTYTSFNQTINDMLADYENTDMQALYEALGNYYQNHNETFDGLIIKPENEEHFLFMKEDVANYFCGG